MKNASIRQTGLDVIRELSAQEELQELPGFQTQLEHFQKRFQDDEFRIAVVGEFSSGKSTFINALIGQDVLQHALKETTATLTRLVNVAQNDPRKGKGCVTLRNGKKLNLENLQELRDYTTTSSQKLDVAAEVAQVEIYLPIFASKHPIVIVDTPGLNGMADGHREQTEELIQQAHACIYLIQRRGLSESDLSILRKLVQFQKNFIFVQNFIDTLDRAEGETPEKKLEEQKEILLEKVFMQAKDAQYSLCGISAWQALAARDRSIQTLYADESARISEEERKKLYADSNFQQLLELLQGNFSEENLTQIQYGGTAKAMITWMSQLTQKLELQKKQLDETYELSRDRRMTEYLDAQIRKVQAEQEQNEQQLMNFIKVAQNDLKKAEKTALEEHIANLRENTLQKIQCYGREKSCVEAAQEIEDWQKDTFARELNDELHILFQKEQNDFLHREENVGQLILSRIDEYRGPKSEGLDLDEKKFRVDTLNLSMFEMKKKIDAESEKLASDIQELEQTDRRIGDIYRRMDQYQTDAATTQYQYQNAQKTARFQKESLGNRPAPEIVETSHWEKRTGIFGRIGNVLLGPKELKQEIEDDSKGQEWDKEYAKLMEYQQKEMELKQKAALLESETARLRRERRDCEENHSRLEQRIAERKKRLQEEQQLLQKEKTAAADEYLAMSKKKLSEQVVNYLSVEMTEGHPWYEMWIILEKQIAAAETEYTRVAVDQFRRAIRQKVYWLEKAKEGQQSELQKQSKILEKYSRQITYLKCKMEEQLL